MDDPAWLKPLVEGLGYTYWPGGDAPPEDWDGGKVLCRDPKKWDMAGIWRRMPGSPDRDVIGYRARPCIDLSGCIVSAAPIWQEGDGYSNFGPVVKQPGHRYITFPAEPSL